MTGLVGAGAILLLLVAVPGLLAPVPTAALAAVVISAVLSLFDIWGPAPPVARCAAPSWVSRSSPS